MGAPLSLEVITFPGLILFHFLKLSSESTPLEQKANNFCSTDFEKHERSNGIFRNNVGPYARVISR